MYRNAGLRLACAGCGAEQAVSRMTLAPLGGHQCWKCEMRAQIAEHKTPPANGATRALRPRRRWHLQTFGFALAMLGLSAALCAILYGALVVTTMGALR